MIGWITAILVIGVNYLLAAESAATNQPAGEIDFMARAKTQFNLARAHYQSETNSPQAAWQFARACFDLAEFATSRSERAELAETGIGVAQKLTASHSDSAPAHYYLAMNLGQLARTKSLGALRLVEQMETEFSAAAALDEHIDFAGPDRNLGVLYLEAPSFASIGSRTKARQHLLRAMEVEPDYPENRLDLIEAYLKWGDRAAATRELKALENIWPEAKKKYGGDKWALNWIDWGKKLQKLKDKIVEPSRQLESPREKNY